MQRKDQCCGTGTKITAKATHHLFIKTRHKQHKLKRWQLWLIFQNHLMTSVLFKDPLFIWKCCLKYKVWIKRSGQESQWVNTFGNFWLKRRKRFKHDKISSNDFQLRSCLVTFNGLRYVDFTLGTTWIFHWIMKLRELPNVYPLANIKDRVILLILLFFFWWMHEVHYDGIKRASVGGLMTTLWVWVYFGHFHTGCSLRTRLQVRWCSDWGRPQRGWTQRSYWDSSSPSLWGRTQCWWRWGRIPASLQQEERKVKCLFNHQYDPDLSLLKDQSNYNNHVLVRLRTLCYHFMTIQSVLLCLLYCRFMLVSSKMNNLHYYG